MEDANFESGNAEAGILRLFTLIEWVKEMIDPEVKLREGGEMTFHDKVFVAEMNKLVKASGVAYEKLLFKEALRNGFFELQRSRDKYRELCGPAGMRKDLVLRSVDDAK